MVDGPWLMAQGSPAGARGPTRGGGGPGAPAGLPGAMSHEPFTMNNRLINYVVNYSIIYYRYQVRVLTGPTNPEIMKVEVFGFSHTKIEKLLVPNEAE